MGLYVSISAAVIALCSLCVSIWQGHIARKHARLSVKPDLGIHFSISADSGFIGIAIENNGLGSARITGIKIENLEDVNNPQMIVSDSKGWRELLTEFGLRNGRVKWSSINPRESIPAGENHHLIEIPNDDPDLEELQGKLREMQETLGMRIDYESMYKEVASFVWPPKS